MNTVESDLTVNGEKLEESLSVSSSTSQINIKMSTRGISFFPIHNITTTTILPRLSRRPQHCTTLFSRRDTEIRPTHFPLFCRTTDFDMLSIKLLLASAISVLTFGVMAAPTAGQDFAGLVGIEIENFNSSALIAPTVSQNSITPPFHTLLRLARSSSETFPR